jgi:hypothetical protein
MQVESLTCPVRAGPKVLGGEWDLLVLTSIDDGHETSLSPYRAPCEDIPALVRREDRTRIRVDARFERLLKKMILA